MKIPGSQKEKTTKYHSPVFGLFPVEIFLLQREEDSKSRWGMGGKAGVPYRHEGVVGHQGDP